jgi:hypothetical protein
MTRKRAPLEVIEVRDDDGNLVEQSVECRKSPFPTPAGFWWDESWVREDGKLFDRFTRCPDPTRDFLQEAQGLQAQAHALATDSRPRVEVEDDGLRVHYRLMDLVRDGGGTPISEEPLRAALHDTAITLFNDVFKFRPEIKP